MAKELPKISEQEAEKIERAKNLRQTTLLKEYCRRISELPEDFRLGSELTDATAEEYLKPVANDMYQFVKANGMTVGDIEKVDMAFKAVYNYTLERAMNFTDTAIDMMMFKTFGYTNLLNEMPIADIEKRALFEDTEDEG